jgi:DNA modification methylase
MTDTQDLAIAYVPIETLIPYANNARTHSQEQIRQIARSIEEFGFNNPVLVDGNRGVIAGHGRILAADLLGRKEVPVIELKHMTEAQKRAYIIADNQLAINAGWDEELLSLEIKDLQAENFDIELLGFQPVDLEHILNAEQRAANRIAKKNGDGALAEQFLLPPFSVLDARAAWWQDRKKEWVSLGIASELGREGELAYSTSILKYASSTTALATGTSVFDPVLCDVMYRWFSPPNGLVLDPFSGGSVRGVVAERLGRGYYGIDLREEQVKANQMQGEQICEVTPTWVAGDSNDDKSYASLKGGADFLFSCPPYADLEQYSDNPLDLSTMSYEDFKLVYASIIKRACARLKDDRFAAFVVGEVRGPGGEYYNFVGDTINAFRAAGLEYYNEIILQTMIGTLPLRVANYFNTSRKIGKTHQNVLVFLKGDAKKATQACGMIAIDESLFGPDDLPDEAAPQDNTDSGYRKVKVSAAMARLEFAGCQPDYIRDVCHASCCQSSSSPTGTIITIHPREVPAIEARGGVVKDGLLQPKPGEKKCPFKTTEDLCGIHFTPDKPFGCIASPFTLNANGTLIVRNRYKTLKCYKDGDKVPAYKAFSASLKLIFGEAEAARITAHLDAGGDDIMANMPAASYETLMTNDEIKHHQKGD